MGYSTYLSFTLGYASTLVTIYYLAIRNIPGLLALFPRFLEFSVIATVSGAPIGVLVGWLHLKRSALFQSEQEIAAEANPYTYKLPPGIPREVYYPAFEILVRLVRDISEKQGVLAEADKSDLIRLEEKLKILNSGGLVGTPRRSRI
jgi:hypothetical protein